MSARARLLAAATLGVALVGPGCGGAPAAEGPSTWTGPGEGVPAARSGTSVERFFPLEDGKIYHYETIADGGDRGMLVARVHRAAPERGELRFPSGVRRFEYVADGVKVETDDEVSLYVLQAPLELGQEWRGEHGGKTRVTAVDRAVKTAAGSFTGCVETTEERGGDRPVRYVTTFCPDVGVVVLEAMAGQDLERAELKSYAAPVDIGPEGLVRTQ